MYEIQYYFRINLRGLFKMKSVLTMVVMSKLVLGVALIMAHSTPVAAGIAVEAEDFTTTGGTYGGFQTYTINDIGAINFNQSGDWADYQVEIPNAGRYKVSMFAGTPVNGAGAKLFVSGITFLSDAAVPSTGSWDNFQEVVLAKEVELLAGTTYFQLSSFGSPNSWEWNADRIVFSPVSNGEGNQPPALEPDTATVTANLCQVQEWKNSVVINNHENDYDPDGDSLFYTAFESPANGYISQQSINGVVVYTPNVGFTGVDTYTYTLSDGVEEVTQTTTVHVYAESNIAPLAYIDNATTSPGTPVIIDVLANDVDENDCDTLTVPAIVRAASNGTVTINSDDSVTYTPNPGFVGRDSFDYSLSDGDALNTYGSAFIDVE